MKKLLVMFLFVAVSISAFAYETVPYMFHNMVPYGITPDEVNEILMASNFSSAAAEPISGTFYVSKYPDPDLVWYNTHTMNWINVKFTTNDVSELFTRDSGILYFNYVLTNEFKCMIVRADNINDDATLAGKQTKWAYKFFFHEDKLFAVSAVYEGDYTLEQYKSRNEGKEYAHPGYVMSRGLFSRTLGGFHTKYGGFHNSRYSTFDDFTSMRYGNYINKAANTSLAVYYATYGGKNINFVASYVDNFRMQPIANRFQKSYYENYFDFADVPVGITPEINPPKDENADENNTQATDNAQ
ncbi:hypothetical protein SZ47_04585 [Brachyspira hyodysenteriae]|uniref:Uncharacterized protein n=1 Tax=Brachyspira hyodysenteriae ATCC 27164 TaxID=1266923 RepID=A0A3B6VU75_BRAHO|nr:hypothetical protein [Brachyspira hyodysenteriae]ANN64354.1 hypothetical protein BHYOB78_10880 [Brachyspira hyodysenteriae ATCC 27164]KLI27576.1 hypothetical protein SZ47_04585 [Brachyspira hyodysenteriae]MCZ9924504.1 hypothetical protein [Brachyspira hyodysenteriae]